jgi:hypothetical protein
MGWIIYLGELKNQDQAESRPIPRVILFAVTEFRVILFAVTEHRLTGTFVVCNRRYLKSWIGNSSEGPF